MYAILEAGVCLSVLGSCDWKIYAVFRADNAFETFTRDRYFLRGCGPEICVAVDQFADPDHDFVIASDEFPVIINVCVGTTRSRLRIYR